MPRADAKNFKVIGVELQLSEVEALDYIAFRKGINRPELLRRLLRDFIAKEAAYPALSNKNNEGSSL